MNYRETCNHQVTLWEVNHILDAFCAFVCKAKEAGVIAEDVAERQIEAAVDVEIAFEDRKVNDEVRAKFAKIRDFNRKHHLAA